ncbi:MAG: amidohydrolase [Clostridia bacterium]|nr:amidohydrolase [Clostridia bacterium]MBR6755025.1 amidohydrolase [Clostridia bacterium]
MNLLIKNIILPDGDAYKYSDIYVSDDTIVGIGSSPENFVADEIIEGEGRIAIPAFVNAHTHAYMSVLRNAADDLPFMTWLFEGVMPREEKLNNEQAYWGSLLACAEMIKRGCGTFCDMHLFPGASAKAAVKSGMRAVVSRGLTGSDGGQRRLDEQYAEIEEWKDHKNISFMLAPHAIYTCDKEFLLKVSSEAKRLGLGLNIHLSESKAEFGDCLRDNGCTPTEYCESLGLFENKTLAAHCVQLTENDISILAKRGVSVASNPKSNLKLGNGIAPIYQLDQAGVNVCIGTDSAASNNSLNMFSELNYMTLLHKGTNYDSTAIPAKKALDFATVNGAKALGYDNLGKLEVGYIADIALLDTNVPQMVPLRNYYAAVCYCCDGSETDTLILDGKVVMKNKKLLTIDEEELYYNINKIVKETD